MDKWILTILSLTLIFMAVGLFLQTSSPTKTLYTELRHFAREMPHINASYTLAVSRPTEKPEKRLPPAVVQQIGIYNIRGNYSTQELEIIQHQLPKLIIGVITTKQYHESRLKIIYDSWAREWIAPLNRTSLSPMIVFISDEEEKQKQFPWTLIQKAPCPSDYRLGLCCKTSWFFKHFPQVYPEKTWFLRVIDDSWVHVENLLLLLGRLPEDIPVYLGHRFCRTMAKRAMWTDPMKIPDEFCFPGGGAGWLVNRKVVDIPGWDEQFNISVKEAPHPEIDDVAWGETMKRIDVPITPYKGFNHYGGVGVSKCIPWYMCPKEHEKGQIVQLPFLPITFHGALDMRGFDDAIHLLKFEEIKAVLPWNSYYRLVTDAEFILKHRFEKKPFTQALAKSCPSIYPHEPQLCISPQ